MARTREELIQIGKDIAQDKIFLATDIPSGDYVPLIFLPFALMADNERKEFAMKLKNGGMFLAYFKDALPRGINGYPMFGSFMVLEKEEWEIAKDAYEKARKALDAIQ